MEKKGLDPQIRESIRLEYITRNATLSNLADKHGIPVDTLRTIAEDEGWHGQRDEYWRGVYSDVIHATRTATANLMASTVSTADRLIRWAKAQMTIDKATGEVLLDPDEVLPIARSIHTSLDVLKFTLGEPDNLIISTNVEPTAKDYVLAEAAIMLKRIISDDADGGEDE